MKAKITALAAVLCLLATCLGLLSCAKPLEKYSAYSFDFFDTATVITGYAESREAFDGVADEILAELEEYHRLFTIYHRYEGMENLCTVNELVNGQHRTVTVDKRIIDLLLYAKQTYVLTNGHVNIAMGSVLSIWHEYRTIGRNDPSAARLPAMDELEEAAKHTDIDCLQIDEKNSTVTITDPAMRLDVGAIAKGYAVEMVAQTLEQKGITGYLLNVGGNVRAVGAKPDGSGWTVGLESPVEDEDYLAYLSLTTESLVTSGSYQRYYVVDGKRYHHVIHPDTLMPAENYLSVSVITASSAMGDALSTALFCMSRDEGLALVAAIPDTEVQWVAADGTVFATDGWTSYTVAE